MSSEDKKMNVHFDASDEGQESKAVETPAGVEAAIRGGEEGVAVGREGEEREAAKEGEVPADDEAAGKACEWPSTRKSSQKLRKPQVTFSRKVVQQLVEIVEGPGTKNKRRIATGEAMGTTVGVLARPNMEKPREPEELSQDQIHALLGSFKGAPPVNAPKPTHCRKTCGGGPCLPETCSCALGEIKCSIDARCRCGPSNCPNYDTIEPVRDVAKANAVWRAIQMPDENDTIQSVDSIPVAEAQAGVQEQIDVQQLDEVAGSFDNLSKDALEEMPGQEGGSIDKEDEGSMENGGAVVEMGAKDRFVTRRRVRRVASVESSESPIPRQVPRPPNNTQETPSKVKDFVCYWCGAMLSSKRDYELHSLYHHLAAISHQISGLEPHFRMEFKTATGHAAQVLNAPYITVQRRVLKRKMAERADDEPVAKRRAIDSGSVIVVDDVEERMPSDGAEDVAGLEDPMADDGVEERIEMEEEEEEEEDEEDEEELEESRNSEGAEEMEWLEEIGRIAQTLLDARIQEIPIEEARALVATIKTSRDGFGRIVIGERQDDDAIRADGVWFEGLDEMERVAGQRLEEMVQLVSDVADDLEAPRFVSNLGNRISMDRLDLDDAPFDETILDQMEDDGEDSGAGGDEDAEAGHESDDDVDAAASPKNAINLEEERIGEQLLKMLPKMLKDADFESCTQDKCITTNALFCGLMQEASMINKKEMTIGVLSPSVLKDWKSGRKLKKAEIDELLFNRDPQLILIPIYQPARNFESGKIEHWSVGSYDVGACSFTIYDSIEPTKDEKGAVVELVKEFMNEWVGDDEARCVKYRYARKDRVEKQTGIENKSNSGLFVLLHARRLAQLEKDCSRRGRAPIDVKNERKELLKTMKTAKQDFEKLSAVQSTSGQNPTQQQQNQRKRKLPALTTPDYVKARRDNSETREKIRRCYRELKKRC